MTWLAIGLVLAGLALLLLGAELLVRGASAIAAALGLSPLVIGLSVVAFGTSSPELAASLQAALAGQPDLALGNVVGSNIFNVLLILGVSAAITPLVVDRQLLRVDLPVMIGVSLAVLALAWRGRIGAVAGWLLVAALIGYTVLLVRLGRRASEELRDEFATELPAARPRRRMATLGAAAEVAAGLLLLVVGARWLVDGAVDVARTLGVDELVIGLTLIAAGTSLPEVATSVVAAIRGHRDIAVGNVVGSNVFNLTLVLGSSAVVAGDGMTVSREALAFDIPLMALVAVVCWPLFFTGRVVARWEGWLLLAGYAAYIGTLVLRSVSSS